MDTYSTESTDYYYSYIIGSGNYYGISLRINSSLNRFDIYLFSDSSYNNVLTYDLTGDQTKLVVYRSTGSKILYPKIRTFSGTGNAYIYANGDTLVAPGTIINNTLNASSYPNRYFALYRVSLNTFNQYKIAFNAEPGSEFDLIIFRSDESSSERLDEHSATNISTTGHVEFNPSKTDNYVIVLMRQSESGDGDLIIHSGERVGGIPGFKIMPILFAFAIIIYLTLKFDKKTQKYSL
ncbi:MAG: hypothetical protein GF329_16510 [Candidatus Lokiarchaeota archaeon]|nr:hypothetical protein [Candidatus Lokiarchaeota archaeon]